MTRAKPSVLAALLAIGLGHPVLAEQLPAPTGPVLLTVSGDVSNETSKGVVELDMAALEALEPVVFSTSTIWMDDAVEFTGVPLRALLAYAGAEGETVSAVALNDYKVDIPVSEIDPDVPVVAYLMDGEVMSPRGKGPLWIVYPYDEDAKYRSEVIYSRSIWQLDRIVSHD